MCAPLVRMDETNYIGRVEAGTATRRGETNVSRLPPTCFTYGVLLTRDWFYRAGGSGCREGDLPDFLARFAGVASD